MNNIYDLFPSGDVFLTPNSGRILPFGTIGQKEQFEYVKGGEDQLGSK